MVRIRLTRTGRRNKASFRIAVMDRTASIKSRAIEYIGSYDPHTKELNINKERAEYWLSVGAQPTETVTRFFVKEKLMEEPKFKRTFNKKPGKKATERAESAEGAKESEVLDAEGKDGAAAEKEDKPAEKSDDSAKEAKAEKTKEEKTEAKDADVKEKKDESPEKESSQEESKEAETDKAKEDKKSENKDESKS